MANIPPLYTLRKQGFYLKIKSVPVLQSAEERTEVMNEIIYSTGDRKCFVHWEKIWSGRRLKLSSGLVMAKELTGFNTTAACSTI